MLEGGDNETSERDSLRADKHRSNMKVTADGYFAIIPEWVLYADISPAAVRVYCVLHRHADNDTAKCIPSRKHIASKARLGLSSVDRAIDELVRIKALIVQHRKSENGDPTSNEYTVIVNRPLSTQNRPPIENEQTGLFKSDNLIKANLNESQESNTSTEVEVAEQPVAKPLDEQIAASWWEAQEKKPLGKNAWWALRNVIKAALDRGYEPAEIRDALERYGTVPSLVALDKQLKSRTKPTQSRREENIAALYNLFANDTKELNP